VIPFPTSLLLWLKCGTATFGGGGIDDTLIWSITSPLSQWIISSMIIRAQHWEGDSHVTDTEQNIF
jgi:hypothetical protein